MAPHFGIGEEHIDKQHYGADSRPFGVARLGARDDRVQQRAVHAHGQDSGDQCSYAGPRQVSTRLTVTWDIRNANPSVIYGFAIVTLGEGKTLKDLTALIGGAVHPQPTWVTTIVRAPVGRPVPGNTFLLSVVTCRTGPTCQAGKSPAK